jgi:DNA-binding beta-propeller fold protein YncE
MKKIHFLFIISLGLINACKKPSSSSQNSESAIIKQLATKRITLPNGWSLTPVGKTIELKHDLPLNMVVSPSKKYLAITNNGQSKQSISLIDVANESILADQEIEKSWVGLAFSTDEKTLYASGGNDNKINIYSTANQTLSKDSAIVLGKAWPNKISPTGLCVDSDKNLLYVVTKENNALYICDTKEHKVLKQVSLPHEAYTCILSPNKKQLYISLWGGAKIAVFDTEKQIISAEIEVDKNPNDLLLTKDGKYLFTSHGNDNTVSVIETASNHKIESLSASIYPNSPLGTTPNGVALSEDETKLFIANADNNCLAVFDVSEKGKSHSLGFIPTGWYPTSVKVIGNKIYVANGKGMTSLPNPKGPNPNMSKAPQYKGPNFEANRDETEYIGGLFKGTLSIIDMPDEKTLAAYSQLVYENSPYNKQKELMAEGETDNPIPMKVGDASPIKYVFYIVKENRTYDQVLGDVKAGNGDASLCIFPEKVTPNLHKLVKDFVLLDNFYVDAEVSADGHNWSMAAYANDYVEKTWVISYGGRGGSYDYEGSRKIAHPKDGFIWTHAQKAGVSYRTYGEFAESSEQVPALKGHVCKNFKGYSLAYQDIKREKEWEADFDSLLAINAVPQLSTIRLGNDHTSGARLGAYSPFAAVGDNDLAVGKLVEHLSKSKIWKESVVFVLEDDAQNGPDHVDAHRSPAYIAGGFVKRGFVDHTMYSTSSMLRTIELILGIKPMSQYDAAATAMYRSFTKNANTSPFVAALPSIDLEEKNVAVNKNSIRSGKLNLAQPDAINDLEFGRIVWQTVRGLDSKMPAPKRSAFVRLGKGDDDEEEGDDDDD